MTTHQHDAQMPDAEDLPRFARSFGVLDPDGDTGTVKTKLPESLAAEFLVACQRRGGRSAVLRDLICLYLHGKTFAEHLAESRRVELFGPGTHEAPFVGHRESPR